ncbi:MAG: hypothetical protein WCI57_03825 [Candidatus Berkelbacteria bacterium]
MNEIYSDGDENMTFQQKVQARELDRVDRTRSQLEIAKEQCPEDKERFSIDEFQKIYDLTNDNGESIITPAVIEDLETQYYLTYGNVKSMKEFAELREILDGNKVN